MWIRWRLWGCRLQSLECWSQISTITWQKEPFSISHWATKLPDLLCIGLPHQDLFKLTSDLGIVHFFKSLRCHNLFLPRRYALIQHQLAKVTALSCRCHKLQGAHRPDWDHASFNVEERSLKARKEISICLPACLPGAHSWTERPRREAHQGRGAYNLPVRMPTNWFLSRLYWPNM